MSELTGLPIRKILDQLYSGQIRIPAFQREFVWDPEQIAHFMDSLYKGYPFGSLLFWETQEQLKEERHLGPFKLPEPRKKHPVSYVLDGQQRLTSIFLTFQTEYDIPQGDDWMSVYFDMTAPEDAQQKQFIALKADEVDPARHFPLTSLFDPVKYRESLLTFPDERHIHAADTLHSTFKEAQIPIQIMETDDRATVAVVFERINRFGVKLSTLELLSAWTWSEEFDLRRQLEELQDELVTFNFGDLAEEPDLVLRCAAAVLAGSPAIDSLIELRGEDIRKSFTSVKNGIKGAIDFLRDQLHIRTLKTLPYQLLIVPLSVFFAVPDSKMLNPTDAQLTAIKRWFWLSCFTERYAGQTVRAATEDIVEMKRLRNDLQPKSEFSPIRIRPTYFTYNNFRIGNARTATFVNMLAQLQPRSFISGARVAVDEVLQKYNRTEFHHIYPKAYVEKSNSPLADSVNCLANFCFLSRVDNNKIRAKAPSEYAELMTADADQRQEILDTALIVYLVLVSDDFSTFISNRSAQLAEVANSLIQTGKPPRLDARD